MEENTRKMTPIRELSNLTLKIIMKNGYCWSQCSMKDIPELRFFFNQVEEEIKRRKMNRPTGQNLVGRCFRLDVMSLHIYFRVSQWLPVNENTAALAAEHRLHGFINATGFMIENIQIGPNTTKITRIGTNTKYNQDDNQFADVPQITVGTDELGLIVSSRIFDDEDEEERILAEEITPEKYDRHLEAFDALGIL